MAIKSGTKVFYFLFFLQDPTHNNTIFKWAPWAQLYTHITRCIHRSKSSEADMSNGAKMQMQGSAHAGPACLRGTQPRRKPQSHRIISCTHAVFSTCGTATAHGPREKTPPIKNSRNDLSPPTQLLSHYI